MICTSGVVDQSCFHIMGPVGDNLCRFCQWRPQGRSLLSLIALLCS